MKIVEENLGGGTRADVAELAPCMNCGNHIGPAEAYRIGIDEQGQSRVWHIVRLYFDESARVVRDTLQRMGFCVAPTLPEGTPDTEWLAQAGKNGWTVITEDNRITKNPVEYRALIENEVKCFILPGRAAPTSSWDKVRGFVSMWEKVQTESLFPGPFVWRFDDETQPVRWEQVYPEELVFSPLDLSKTPVGHLLNLFAEVVSQHDLGWFSRSYVEGLHENIRREIEARITGDRSGVFEDSNERVRALSNARIGGSSGDQIVPLDRPTNLRVYREALVVVAPEGGTDEYPLILPAHLLRVVMSTQGGPAPGRQIEIDVSPTGFHRTEFVRRPR